MIFLLHWDPRGEVEDYVLHLVRGLRPHAERIVAMSNGALTPAGRERLESVADAVWERENVGLDAWGHKTAMERFGLDELAGFDELILMNTTFYGPIGSFASTFERMDAAEVDFWGMTEHARVVPNGFTGRGVMNRHLQSYWLAVRSRMFRSDEWLHYWENLPEIRTYLDAVLKWETELTTHFEELGFVDEVAYAGDHRTLNPAMFDPETLLDEGMPIVKRRIFFEDPMMLVNERVAAWRVALRMMESGYPADLLWPDLARHTAPRVLQTNSGAYAIDTDATSAYDAAHPLAIAVAVHVVAPSGLVRVLLSLRALPGPHDLYITVADEKTRSAVEAALAEVDDSHRAWVEVRVLERRGDRYGMEALVVALRDVIDSERYDVIVKLRAVERHRGADVQEHALASLLGTPNRTANALALLQSDATIGVVQAPIFAAGSQDLGDHPEAGFDAARSLARQLGIRVPLDDAIPLLPPSAAMLVRPAALRLLLDTTAVPSVRPHDHERDLDLLLGGARLRLITAAAGELGFRTFTTINARYAAALYDSLYFAFSGNELINAGPIAHLMYWLRKARPRVAQRVDRPYQRARRAWRTLREARGRQDEPGVEA
ncbi:rhamnan synthesis F family protein [Mesorhizobium japonicum]|uniref:rhamnan synthesis F family protein n=1 Tax=Mesorhizobium japonicum TaxID=2066070 RepID=UPI003B596D3F